MLLVFGMKALLKSYGEVVGNATDLVELSIELREKRKSFSRTCLHSTTLLHKRGKNICACSRRIFFKSLVSTHFIEFAFESVVVDIIGDVLQLAMLVEIDNGVVSESIDDFAVVYKLCVGWASDECDEGMFND